MKIETIKETLLKAIENVCKDKTDIVEDPATMFVRNRKIPLPTFIQSTICMGAGKTTNEIIDCFRKTGNIPTESAWVQQKNKIKPRAIYKVMREFNTLMGKNCPQKEYRLLAADGSSVTYPSNPGFSDDTYYYNPGNFSEGAYGIHVNALYDIDHNEYVDAELQPVHQKDEFAAFCTMVDRQTQTTGTKNIYIGDRGFCSYNTMAHVIESGQYFLFRAKDIDSKGVTCKLSHPDTDSFDVMERITLVRYHSKQWKGNSDYRFIDSNTNFDYIDTGSKKEYTLSFRLVRFPLSDNSFESILTNLPEDEFPIERIKKLYFMRWGIETSFRNLKYTIGLTFTHSYKPQGVMIEIFSKLLFYNFTSACADCVTADKMKTLKYRYKTNFSTASHICREYLWLFSTVLPELVSAVLQRYIIPIRENRSYPRLKTAHFRKPRYPNYRPS